MSCRKRLEPRAMLKVQNLSCRRGGRVVFCDTGFSVEPGGFLLVTGANGSGKSTLLRILAGLLPPKSGHIHWRSANIAEDSAAHRARLHYIGHLDAVKPGLIVREMLDYWRALRGAAKNDLASLDAFGLEKLADRPIRSLSAGQKRRLSLTRLVLDTAPLWLLDEPTTALDSEGQSLLIAQIARHRASGGIVVAATHDELAVPDMQRLMMPQPAS